MFSVSRALKLIATTSFSAAVLAGCSSTSTTNQAPTLVEQLGGGDFSVVTGSTVNLNLSKGTRFAWQAPIKVYGELDGFQNTDIRLQQSVSEILLAKGFSMVSADQADYLLAGYGFIGDLPEGASALPDPGLDPHVDELTKGALTIVVKNHANMPLWRGTAQLFTSTDIPVDVRVERSERAVARLLSDIKVTN